MQPSNHVHVPGVRNRDAAAIAFCSLALCTALVLSSVLAVVLPWGGTAYAEVLKADIVLGETVEQRGLTVSQCPNIEAQHAIVIDERGTTYFERDADAPAKIASITKVMTAVTAIGAAPLETMVTVSGNASTIGESSAELYEGDTMTLYEALKAMLIPSGNDAAQAISESIGALLLSNEGQTTDDITACEARFVAEMNAKSAALGMTNSLWTNPHGLDDWDFESDQHSTASDLSILARHAMSIPEIREITAQDTGSCTVNRGGEQLSIILESTDELLGAYEGAMGIKTGYTDSAGNCFAGACARNGIEVYSIVLNSTDEVQRFTDTTELWDWVFAHTVDYALCNCPTTTANQRGEMVPLAAEVPNEAWFDATIEATFEDPQASVRVFDLSGNISQSVEYRQITGDVHAGDVVGTISFIQHNQIIASANLVAARDDPAPNIFQAIGIWWTKLIGRFAGDDGIADSKLYNQTPLLNDKALQNAA